MMLPAWSSAGAWEGPGCSRAHHDPSTLAATPLHAPCEPSLAPRRSGARSMKEGICPRTPTLLGHTRTWRLPTVLSRVPTRCLEGRCGPSAWGN